MQTFSVAFYGLPRNADAAARSMLRLLLPMLGNRWRSEESSRSDVVILEPETLAEMKQTGALRRETLYIVLANDDAPQPDAFATIQRPLNSGRLIELLHTAQAELDKRSSPLGNTTIAPSSGGSSTSAAHGAERGMRTSIRLAIRVALQTKSRSVTIQDLKQNKILSVVPGAGFANRLRSSELADLIRGNAQVSVIELGEKEVALLRLRRNFEPLGKLEWIYWLTGSNGEIRPELKLSRAYQLRKYPDFAVLPHHRSDVRMASLLKAEPLTVGDLAHRADVRLETACNFVNACWALGYLGDPKGRSRSARSSPAKAEVEEETQKEEAGGLMDRLRKLRVFR